MLWHLFLEFGTGIRVLSQLQHQILHQVFMGDGASALETRFRRIIWVVSLKQRGKIRRLTISIWNQEISAQAEALVAVVLVIRQRSRSPFGIAWHGRPYIGVSEGFFLMRNFPYGFHGNLVRDLEPLTRSFQNSFIYSGPRT